MVVEILVIRSLKLGRLPSLKLNRVMQDAFSLTITVTEKTKEPSLDIFSSVKKSGVEFKAEFFCPAQAIFTTVVPMNGDSRTLRLGRVNV